MIWNNILNILAYLNVCMYICIYKPKLISKSYRHTLYLNLCQLYTRLIIIFEKLDYLTSSSGRRPSSLLKG